MSEKPEQCGVDTKLNLIPAQNLRTEISEFLIKSNSMVETITLFEFMTFILESVCGANELPKTPRDRHLSCARSSRRVVHQHQKAIGPERRRAGAAN